MASIQGIYIALFGRPADTAGLSHWNAQTGNGQDLSTLVDSMANQPEALGRFDNLEPAQIVTLIYQSLFGRDPEAKGLSFFVDQLQSGAQKLATIAINILDGAQGDDACLIDNKIAAADQFTAALDTQAEQDAYNGNAAADIGRTFLSAVTCEAETVPTSAQAQEVINTLLAPSGGQQPSQDGGSNGGGATGGGGVNVAPRLDTAAANTVSADSFKPVLASDLQTEGNGFGFTLDAEGTEAEFNFRFETAGDVNHDGIADILIGATNKAYLVHGSSSLSGAESLAGFNTPGGPAGTLFTANGDDEPDGKLNATGVGDINGDGIDDVAFSKTIAKNSEGALAGKVYVVYGQEQEQDGGLAQTVELNDLSGSDGFAIEGEPGSRLGFFVGSAGDFNGDGIRDLGFANDLDETFVLFGTDGGPNSNGDGTFTGTLDHRSFDGHDGVKITSSYDPSKFGQLGDPLASAGDINGDGIEDLVLGEVFFSAVDFESIEESVSGLAHIVFGSNTPGPTIDVNDLDGSDGFFIAGGWYPDGTGAYFGGALGFAADGIGDINGDGFDDLIVAELAASKGGIDFSGAAYVIFGSSAPGAFPAEFDEKSLDGSNGFSLFGVSEGIRLGRDVTSAGDLNNDGLDDFIVTIPGSTTNPGTAHILFGQSTGFDPVFDFSTLGDDKVGFSLTGENNGDRFGYANDSLGDVNNDGIDDIAILAPGTDHGNGEEGTLYVIFGSDDGVLPGLSLSTGSLGFIDTDTTILAEARTIDQATSVVTVTPSAGSVGTFHAFVSDGTDTGTGDATGQIDWTFDPTGIDFAALDFLGGPITQTFDIAIEQDGATHLIETVGVTLNEGFEVAA